jgi:hypothetical protein
MIKSTENSGFNNKVKITYLEILEGKRYTLKDETFFLPYPVIKVRIVVTCFLVSQHNNVRTVGP